MGAAASTIGISDGTRAEIEQLPEAAQAELAHAAQTMGVLPEGALSAVDASGAAAPKASTTALSAENEKRTAVEAPAVQREEEKKDAGDERSSSSLTPHEQQDGRYTRPETPFALASTGDVKLISYNWLVQHAAAGEPLPRRQELPAAAFADVDALRKSHAAAPKHVAAAVLPILSVS